MSEQFSAPLDEFKPREIEILALMAEGLSNAEIGERLFITTQTVRWYNKQIYSKLGTSRRTEAIALARSMGLIGTASADEQPAPDTRQHIPPTSGPFVGRDDELAELAELLARPEVRLLSIVAVGGMGKSRLSLELANHIEACYEHGAAFIDLTAIRSPDDIAAAALKTLGMMPDSGQDPRDALFAYCREKMLLLIFDNMEHVQMGATLLADLLAVAPGVKLIATSRERLNLRIETVYPLQPVIDRGPALFVEAVTVMRPSITITDDEYRHIHRIITLVGGMPLALTLAATWVDMLSIEEIADEIERSLDFLAVQLGDMSERHHSMRAVIDPTWQRLNDEERQAIMRASVFRGGFTRNLFQQVTGASLRALQALIGRSLIQHGPNRRYDLHPILRQYAREKLTAHVNFDTAKRKHLTTLHEHVKMQDEAMYSGQYIEALDALDQEMDNCRAALDWALAGHAVEAGTELATDLCNFWDIRSRTQEGWQYLTLALEHPLPDRLRALTLCWRSRFTARLGLHDSAMEDANQAVTLAESLGDQEIIARSLLYYSHLLTPEEMGKIGERALVISETIQHPKFIAMSLNTLGNSASHAADYARAQVYYQRAVAQCETIGDLRGLSSTIYNAGLVYEMQQDRSRARDYYERSLQLKQQIGDRAGAARRLAVLAHHHIMDEEMELAVEKLSESRRLCEETGDRSRLAYVLMLEGILEFVTLNFDRAQTTLERGLAVTEALNEGARLCEYYNLLGLFHLRQNQLSDAEPHFMRCLQTAADFDHSYARWLALMGYAQYQWVTERSAASVRLTAVTDRLRSLGSQLDLRFLFDPHVYRVKQQIGKAAWMTFQQEVAEVTLDQLFAETLAQLP